MKRSGYIKRKSMPNRAKVALANVAKRKAALPRVSKRRKAVKADTDGPREAFRVEFGRCMYPYCRAPLNEVAVHEIANGPDREQALYHQELQLVLCWPHHSLIHQENWPPARELALRLWWFPEEPNRASYCKVRGRPDTLVTEEEMQEEIARVKTWFSEWTIQHWA